MVEKDFGRIGVLMGGVSEEREISLKSGKAVYETLKQAGFEVVPIDIDTEDIETNIHRIKTTRIEVAFIALHGRLGEDGTIQRILEGLNLPYTGSGVVASRLALDKVLSRERFLAHQLRVPDYQVLDKGSFNKNNLSFRDLKFPLVVKPATQGSSIGISFADDKEQLLKSIELAFLFDERIIIEEYLKGREFTVGILDEQTLPVIEIIPKKRRFFDYEAKYTKGLTEYVVPAKIDGELSWRIQESAVVAHRALGCFGFSRVDMILKDREVYVLEVNTIPGLTETSLLPKAAKAVGIDFLELCIRLIESAYQRTKYILK
ncbi:MAG: D-alanine--D-alanine ligase [Candidatus Omnitrophica bacterium]|nr:D-alanine--D-alanine ligase [Candidatus Omnitrophota bacterium]